MESNRERSFNFAFRDNAKVCYDNLYEERSTKFDISLTLLRQFKGTRALTLEDLEALTQKEAEELYLEWFWLLGNCDLLPSGADYFLFDSALHSGLATSVRWLQVALGVQPSGYVDSATVIALNIHDTVKVIEEMTKLRRRYLRHCSEWDVYSAAWTNRVTRANARALKMVRGS
jgi:lysozyme family protein